MRYNLRMDITGRLTHDAQVAIHAIRGAGLRPREISLHPEVRAEILKSAAIPTVVYMPRETFMGMEIIEDASIPKVEAQIRYLDWQRKPQVVRIMLD